MIYKSDIKTNKYRCGIARHFNNVFCHPSNPHFYLKVQFIEQMFFNDVDKDIEAILWEHEKYWQSQLFTSVWYEWCQGSIKQEKKKLQKEITFLRSILYLNH